MTHNPWAVTVLSLYPEMFPGPLSHALSGRALQEGRWLMDHRNIRDYAADRHRSVDDTPAGGGAGMVLRADIVAKALDDVEADERPRLLMSPRGQSLNQDLVREFSQKPGLVILCGRFEGVDERVIRSRKLMEVSVGDYILSGGEIAALTLMDAVVRLLPGVMGKARSGEEESFENGLLEYPHYTRPTVFEGEEVPPVLTSGNHREIEKWRLQQAEELTRKRRPDLWQKYRVDKER